MPQIDHSEFRYFSFTTGFELAFPGVKVHIWNPGPGSFNIAWFVKESVESALLEFVGTRLWLNFGTGLHLC